MTVSLESDATELPTELLLAVKLSDGARPVAATARNARELVDRLVELGLAIDAARVLVAALPKRYAIAWVCECIRREAGRAPLSPIDAGCVESAEAWLLDDGEERSRLAFERAAAARYESPASWAAAAAGWCGSSLSPPGYAPVPPPATLVSEACFAAITLLAVREPAMVRSRLAQWVGHACASFSSSRPGAD